MFDDLEALEAEQAQEALLDAELQAQLAEVKEELGKKRKSAGASDKREVSAVAKMRRKFNDSGKLLRQQLKDERDDQAMSMQAQAVDSQALTDKLEDARRIHREMQPFVKQYLKKSAPLKTSDVARLNDTVEAAIRDLAAICNRLLDAQKKRDKEAASRTARIDKIEKRVDDSIRNLLDQVNALASGAQRVTFEIERGPAAKKAAAATPVAAPAVHRSFVASPVDMHRDQLLAKRREVDPSFVPPAVLPRYMLEGTE